MLFTFGFNPLTTSNQTVPDLRAGLDHSVVADDAAMDAAPVITAANTAATLENPGPRHKRARRFRLFHRLRTAGQSIGGYVTQITIRGQNGTKGELGFRELRSKATFIMIFPSPYLISPTFLPLWVIGTESRALDMLDKPFTTKQWA